MTRDRTKSSALAVAETKARGRLKPTKKNGWEEAYERDVLRPQFLSGDIAWYSFESMKLRLADRTYYTPDFIVMRKDGTLEVHEVKGFWRDDARVKIKCAAEQFPMQFMAATRKRSGQPWEIEAI